MISSLSIILLILVIIVITISFIKINFSEKYTDLFSLFSSSVTITPSNSSVYQQNAQNAQNVQNVQNAQDVLNRPLIPSFINTSQPYTTFKPSTRSPNIILPSGPTLKGPSYNLQTPYPINSNKHFHQHL